MTRKDYIAAARVIADGIEGSTDDGRGDIRAEAFADAAKGLADIFALDNSRFDRERFYRACAMTRDDHGWRPNDPDGNPRKYGARPVIDRSDF